MTDTPPDADKAIVISFASQLADARDQATPEDTARSRGWIDDTGAVTAAGRELVASLSDQDQTRSAFRNY